MTDEPVHVDLDAAQIRVLAHPLRARLLGLLRLDGPATATRLAAALTTNTGATSYHLRRLADAGLVAEHPGGAGRERWWRAAHDVSSWRRGDYAGDPDATAAADWLVGYAARVLVERAEAWQRALPGEDPAWRDAAELNDYALTLTAPQLEALMADLDAVVERHRRAAAADPAPDARKVLLYLYGLPRLDT